MTRRMVMIGTSLGTLGGIAAVLQVYRAYGLIGASDVEHIATHRDGSRWVKVATAASGWLQYMALLLRGGVALLHVHSASGPSFWRKFMFITPALAARRPVVLHWHGGGFLDFYARSRPWQQRLIGWTFCRCRRVIALSDQWHANLSGLFPAARVVTIANPVLMPQQPADPAAGPPVLLFLGRIEAAKGIDELLRALPSLLAQLPQARLVIAGSGDLDHWRRRAATLGVAAAVDFPGWVRGPAKEKLLRAASLFVLPSHAEAMPMSVLEAMAYGLPVVATRVGGVPQTLRAGIDGLLVEPGDAPALADALLQLMRDADRRRDMGAAARRHVAAHFAAERIVPRIRELWCEVLAEAQPGSRRV